MKIISNQSKNNKTEIVVKADDEKWADQQGKAYKTLASNLNIQGFRKGHVPAEVAKSKISEQEVLSRALKPMIDELYHELTSSKEIDSKKIIIDALNIDVKELKKNDLQICFIFENYPEVTVPEISSLKTKYTNPVVEDKEIEFEINRMTKNDWMLADKDSQIIAKGDMANIDFEGFLDDKPFPGGTAKAFDLEIGSGSFIPGFEDQLLGLKKGDKKDIFVTFPEDYHEKSLAGKKTKFAITVNNIKQITKPNIDNEYAKKFNLPNVNTLEDLRKHIREQILEMKKLQARDAVVPLISQELIEMTKISYIPESLLKDEKNRIISDVKNRAQQANVDYLKYIDTQLGHKSEADFLKNVDETARKNLVLVLAIEKLIEIMKIEVSEKDLNEYFEKLARYYGTPAEQLKQTFATRLEGLKVFLTQQKLFDEIIKQITPKI